MSTRARSVQSEDCRPRHWIDCSGDNLWVLCDVHHRHKWLGIHAISGPIWGPQDLLNQKFEDQVSTSLAADAQRKKRSRPSSR